MHQSLYKKPSISTIIDQQQRYSIQQMQKIQQSNHKLNLLQDKMKSLLYKDKKHYYNINNNPNNYQLSQKHHFPTTKTNQQQLKHYLQSSKNHHHPSHTIIVQNTNRRQSQQSDDMLLQNNTACYDHSKRQNYQNNLQTNNINKSQLVNQNSIPSTYRQKSTSSLKIFKKKNHQKDIDNNSYQSKLKINQDLVNEQNYSPKNNVILEGYDPKSPSFTQPSFKTLQHNHLYHSSSTNNPYQPQNSISTSSDIFQINQLQLMMQKSIQIKQKQLTLAQQQLQKLQTTKLQQYRKNMQLQIQFQKINKLKTQININPSIIKNYISQQQSTMKIIEQISTTKEQLNTQNEKLFKQLKKLQQQEYNLKLQKKKSKFQLGSMERQLNKILKAKTNKMKQNIQQNYHNYQRQNDQLQSDDKILTKKNHSLKTFRTNKKHSLSNFNHKNMPHKKTQKQRPKVLTVQKKPKTKIDQSKSKQKFTTPIHDHAQHKQQRVSKSTSCSVINRNRHTLAQCQHNNKNCQTDRILYGMVHQLDKLKLIVNKEIIKTKAKKGQRRIIQLYDQRDNIKKQKIAMMR